MKSEHAAPRDIDEYIARFPDGVQASLQAIRKTIRQVAPDAIETIKYQMPTFTLHGNLIHFGAYSKHIGLYPVPRADEAFRDELATYGGEKSTVRFALDKPIPLDLIARIVQFRVTTTAEKAAAKKKNQ